MFKATLLEEAVLSIMESELKLERDQAKVMRFKEFLHDLSISPITASSAQGIDIGEEILNEMYLDGGLRCNNPVRYVHQEVQSVFPGRPISCIVSIDMGTANVISLQKSKIAFHETG